MNKRIMAAVAATIAMLSPFSAMAQDVHVQDIPAGGKAPSSISLALINKCFAKIDWAAYAKAVAKLPTLPFAVTISSDPDTQKNRAKTDEGAECKIEVKSLVQTTSFGSGLSGAGLRSERVLDERLVTSIDSGNQSATLSTIRDVKSGEIRVNYQYNSPEYRLLAMASNGKYSITYSFAKGAKPNQEQIQLEASGIKGRKKDGFISYTVKDSDLSAMPATQALYLMGLESAQRLTLAKK